MKYLIILGDGMADEPIPRLGGRTPLQAARKPTIDRIAALGASGILDTVPEGFAPGSEIAHLSLLGYDVPSVFEGRGSLEAAGMGVEIGRGEMVMRCNLITVEQERIRNHSAGHISTAEAAELIDFLQRRLGGGDVRFHTGVSYRHLLTIRGGDKRLHTVGPHDVPDRPFAEVLPSAADAAAEPTARQLRELIFRSQELLADHPVNRARRAAGKQPATSIWPWSPGYRPRMQTLQERYAPIRNGSVISAVDLIRGIGVCAGLTPVEVEGATGLYDTNYEGKAEAALRALRDEVIVITRSNKRANRYNEGIRRYILSAEEEIESGDMLMVVKNNYHYAAADAQGAMNFIANGDIARLVRLRRFEDFYGFHFADAVLSFADYGDMEIGCKILLDTIKSESPSLTREESNRLFYEVEKDYVETKSKIKRYKEIRENPHFNAVQVKFAYAVTCHKAQGGQWRAVFVDRCLFGDEPMTRDMLRWLYTALTRATEKLYLVNFDPRFYE